MAEGLYTFLSAVKPFPKFGPEDEALPVESRGEALCVLKFDHGHFIKSLSLSPLYRQLPADLCWLGLQVLINAFLSVHSFSMGQFLNDRE